MSRSATPTSIWPASDPNALCKAATALRDGRLVGLPTETVYGLAADAHDAHAVAGVFEAKGRPLFNPLICHVSSLEEAERLAVFDAAARRLADAFWPGPLTLVVPARASNGICDLATAGLDTIAVRVPAHAAARALLAAFGGPLVAPSANPSGRLSPTSAIAVAEAFGDQLAGVLDGGVCAVGLESTVIACIGDCPVMLRPGGLSSEAIEAVVGPLGTPGESRTPASPGMLLKHYAPKARLRLNAAGARAGEAFLGFGPQATPCELSLSPTGDLHEAATRLFAALRSLDKAGYSAIAVAPVPDTGLGRAINDRLERAARR